MIRQRLGWKQEATKHAEHTFLWTLLRGWLGEPRLCLARGEDPWQREDQWRGKIVSSKNHLVVLVYQTEMHDEQSAVLDLWVYRADVADQRDLDLDVCLMPAVQASQPLLGQCRSRISGKPSVIAVSPVEITIFANVSL